jgi:signal transduction histidine kinase
MLVNLKLGLLERKLADDPAALEGLVAESRADLDRALDELRDLAHGIYPQVLTSDGLAGALAEAVEQAPMAAELECDGARRYAPELEAAIYFCCLEALQNAAKHAGANARAAVALREVGDALAFEVADDGVGFDAASANGSAGLQNMADRIGALGGELRVESTPGVGTRVAGSVPVRG